MTVVAPDPGGSEEREDVVEDGVPLALVQRHEAETAQEEGALGGEEGRAGPPLRLGAGFEARQPRRVPAARLLPMFRRLQARSKRR